MRRTIDLIGEAIVSSSRYLPIRNRAAALASTAPPKNYLGQVKAIFDDFVRRWRYVRDPYGRELVTRSPRQVFELVMGGRSASPGAGLGRGVGDCDDAAIAIGGQLAAIGFPVRIATIAPQGIPPGRTMSHVFVQTQVPGLGWISVDPVVYPKHGLGYTPPHSRLVTWDLTGRLLSQHGNAHGLSGDIQGGQTMNTNMNRWEDYAGFGDYGDEDELLDFRQYGIKDFGIYADQMGMLGGLGLVAEVDIDETGRAWTPSIELAPHDYEYLRKNNGSAYHGMLGLGDNGETYIYDEGLGFFRKLFRRIKKGAKRIAGGVKRFGKKLLAKIPGGQYLMKLGKRVWKVAKKFVKPLVKFVGKYAAKLAPVAALIPGYGPAIAAGLYAAGKVANLMNKYSVKIAKVAKGEPARLKFKSGKKAKQFQKALKKAAKSEKRKMRAGKSRVRRRIRAGISPRMRRMMKTLRSRIRKTGGRRTGQRGRPRISAARRGYAPTRYRARF